MTVKMTQTLPFVKETTGALKYGVEDLRVMAVGAVYVRKDHLLAAGHTGPWPREVTVTVEVPE